MAGMAGNPCFSSSFTRHKALNNDLVLDAIISHLGELQDLIEYRLVCHKWNGSIVRKINNSSPSLRIPLRYGPKVKRCLDQYEGRRWANETLKTVCNTLTGTASGLDFNTVVINRDFYLAGVNAQWMQFLQIHGDSILHFKFNIRRGQMPSSLLENHVTCPELVSTSDLSVSDNLFAIFTSAPNLESLNFCIRFSFYNLNSNKCEPLGESNPKSIFKFSHPYQIPQLKKLTKLKIREPHGFQYNRRLLIELISMAPHLTSLYIKPTFRLSTLARVLSTLESKVKSSLTSLGISGANFRLSSGEKADMKFPFLNLTTLELNNIRGDGGLKVLWAESLLQAHHSTLVKLILGKGKNNNGYGDYSPGASELTLPPVMENLKILEVNVSQFRVMSSGFSDTSFPVLEYFTCTGCELTNGYEWAFLDDDLVAVPGHNYNLKIFSVVGEIDAGSKDIIIPLVRWKFPRAVLHFE